MHPSLRGKDPCRLLALRMGAERYRPGPPGVMLVEDLRDALAQALTAPCALCGSRRLRPRLFHRGIAYRAFAHCLNCHCVQER